jgi:hypothetical protein
MRWKPLLKEKPHITSYMHGDFNNDSLCELCAAFLYVQNRFYLALFLVQSNKVIVRILDDAYMYHFKVRLKVPKH